MRVWLIQVHLQIQIIFSDFRNQIQERNFLIIQFYRIVIKYWILKYKHCCFWFIKKPLQ